MSATRTHVVVHHSLTRDGSTVSWGGIRRFHTAWKYAGKTVTEAEARALIARGVKGVEPPWQDVGYHAGVELVSATGEVEALLGRDWTAPAAACPQGNMNSRALHVCVVGNYDAEAPSPAHYGVLVHGVLRPWLRLFGIPVENVTAHHDWNPDKTCPGTRFDMELVRGLCR